MEVNLHQVMLGFLGIQTIGQEEIFKLPTLPPRVTRSNAFWPISWNCRNRHSGKSYRHAFQPNKLSLLLLQMQGIFLTNIWQYCLHHFSSLFISA